MYVCMHVCMYVCVYIYIYIYTCVYLYSCVHILSKYIAYIPLPLQNVAFSHFPKRSLVCVYVHVYMCMRIHTGVCRKTLLLRGKTLGYQLDKHRIRGWRAVYVAGLHGQGCHERSIIVTDICILLLYECVMGIMIRRRRRMRATSAAYACASVSRGVLARGLPTPVLILVIMNTSIGMLPLTLMLMLTLMLTLMPLLMPRLSMILVLTLVLTPILTLMLVMPILTPMPTVMLMIRLVLMPKLRHYSHISHISKYTYIELVLHICNIT